MTIAFLLLAAFSAGILDGIAGGGGLIQLPALLASMPHKETVEILGTSKVAATMGTSASAATYRRKIAIDPRLVIAMIIPAFIGSIGGALLASHISTRALKPIVLLVLLIVVVYTFLNPTLGEVESLKHHPEKRMKIGALCALGIGFYDGVIGPGTGSFFMLAFVAVLGYSFLQASPMAKMVNVTTNIGAIVVFGYHSAVMWQLGFAMGLTNLCGGLIGARIGLRGGSLLIRRIFLVVTTLLIIKIGVDIYRTW